MYILQCKPNCWQLLVLCSGLIHMILSQDLIENNNSNAIESNLVENCEEKSLLWNADTSPKLNSSCKSLSYDEQFCGPIKDDELKCLRERASMHDIQSCNCHESKSNSTFIDCMFVEVCIFTSREFLCDKNYTCAVNDSNHAVNCTSTKGLPPVISYCHTSFIHSTQPKRRCDKISLPHHFMNIFKDSCMDDYKKVLGRDLTWYYLDRVHFNGSKYHFDFLAPIMIAENDKDNKCKLDDVCGIYSKLERPAWKIVLPTLAIIIAIVAIFFGIRKYRIHYKIQEEKWNEFMKNAITGPALECSTDRETFNEQIENPEEFSLGVRLSELSTTEQDTKPQNTEDNGILPQIQSRNSTRGSSSSYVDGYERLIHPNGDRTVEQPNSEFASEPNTWTSFSNDAYQSPKYRATESLSSSNLGEYTPRFPEFSESEIDKEQTSNCLFVPPQSNKISLEPISETFSFSERETVSDTMSNSA